MTSQWKAGKTTLLSLLLSRRKDGGQLAVWTDTFAEGEPEAVKELVITCALTPQTLGNSLALMERWITKEDAGVAEEGAWGSASDANDFDAPHGVA